MTNKPRMLEKLNLIYACARENQERSRQKQMAAEFKVILTIDSQGNAKIEEVKRAPPGCRGRGRQERPGGGGLGG